MKVFISWSGELSGRLARTIHKWLPNTLPYVRPYFSQEDIQKGAKWDLEISKELEASSVCIIVLTRQNLNSEWIMFEAGAISKSVEEARLCTVLFGIEPADVQGPLERFQMTRFSKDDMHRLLKTINSNAQDEAIPPATVDQDFERCWPELERDVSKIMRDYPGPEELELLVSKISPFAGTQFNVAGGGKTDRALEYFYLVLEPALAKAGWEHIGWGVLGEETFQMPYSEHWYGVVTGGTGVVVQAAMHGDKNAAAEALTDALNQIGIPAIKEYAQAKHANHHAVHILVGTMQSGVEARG
jgi:hypothetical protein